MSLAWALAERSMDALALAILGSSLAARLRICADMSIVESGVRNSCDSVARKRSLARFARSASSRPRTRGRRRRVGPSNFLDLGGIDFVAEDALARGVPKEPATAQACVVGGQLPVAPDVLQRSAEPTHLCSPRLDRLKITSARGGDLNRIRLAPRIRLRQSWGGGNVVLTQLTGRQRTRADGR